MFGSETKKDSQISDIPTKITEENVDVFADFRSTSTISSIKSSLCLVTQRRCRCDTIA